jgi:hypothetical protein
MVKAPVLQANTAIYYYLDDNKMDKPIYGKVLKTNT